MFTAGPYQWNLPFACDSRARAPPFVDVFDRALHLIASDDAEEDQVTERWPRDYAHVGANAERLERNELINLTEVVVDGVSEPVVQAVHRR
jgi:hypothetical protein